MSNLRFLFVSHEASRTGAPIVLLHLLKWIKENTEIQISILMLDGGDLLNEFQEIGNVYYLSKSNSFISKVSRKIAGIFTRDIRPFKLPDDLKNKEFDLIYINTIVSLRWAKVLKNSFHAPLLCHVHENSFSINCYYNNILTKEVAVLVDKFIAVSESTKENLVTTYEIPLDKIKVFYEFVPVNEIANPTIDSRIVRNELGIKDEFIVGGSGLTSWRKGIDLFVQLAVQLNKIEPDNNVKFVWVGQVSHFFNNSFSYEAERLNIKNKIIFTGSKKDPSNYFQIFNVFALTSREDPFPLVCLEAASLSKSIICFEESGGIPEKFNNPELILPYGDVHEMAKAILKLIDNPALLMKIGSRHHNMVRNFDVNIIAPEIVNYSKMILNSNA